MEEQPELTADEARRQLEVEVSSLKRELAELRKELAAKVSDERNCVYSQVLARSCS